MDVNIWALIISVISLGLSGFIYFNHDRKIKKQSAELNRLQIEQLNIEKIENTKALIEANVLRPSNSKRLIKIYNKGKGEARNLIIKLDEKIEGSVLQNPSPISELGSQVPIELLYAFSKDSPDKTKIEFKWDDDFKSNNIKTQEIYFR